MTRRRSRGGWLAISSLVFGLTLLPAPQSAAEWPLQVVTDEAVKAALLYNFAKFVDWPGIVAAAPLFVCIVGGEGIATALVRTVSGQSINGHALEVWRPQDSTVWPLCHMLFIAGAENRRSAPGLVGLRALPVLTVSDGKGFAQGDGIIELYIEDGRIRFAINVDAAERSTLRVGARLLGLAKIVRTQHVQ